MTDPNSWVTYGLPAFGIALGIVGLGIAWASARQFDAQFGDVVASASPFPPSVSHLTRLDWVSKRSLDIIVAGAALCLLLPLILLIATAVWASDGKSPLYRHRRLGRDGRSFSYLKFRTMSVNGDAVLAAHLAADPNARAEWEATHKLTNDPRVTSIGKSLRKSGLDELPQLLNVLRGEMSLVGPRPITASEVSRYGNAFATCFSVPPGAMGVWEVLSTKNAKHETRVSVELEYATHWTLRRDLSIMMQFIPATIIRRREDAANRKAAKGFRE